MKRAAWKAWTTKEVARIAGLRGQGRTWKEIARELGGGRTALACRCACIRYRRAVIAVRAGVFERHAPEVRRLHGEGLSGAAIAMRLGRKPDTVRRWLRRLELAPNPRTSPETRRVLAAAARKRVREGNNPGWSHLSEKGRKEAEALGWPETDHPSRARILARLLEGGPATTTALSLALGMPRSTVEWHLLWLQAVGHVLAATRGGLPAKHGREKTWNLSGWLRAAKLHDREGS